MLGAMDKRVSEEVRMGGREQGGLLSVQTSGWDGSCAREWTQAASGSAPGILHVFPGRA